ncbi:MTH1187 family thiamine-binding protein [Marinobacterium arenosum]|uniref:MTH1187 family thiamine-binding protein n=1 Tax=Marinobacterium arenosum TaxID=2862496 RepID=UPI001C93D8A7|nr:MTH1187 family thiamine-binding protein [Marinobacterium arenosum]MBY4676140.1 MTH1187 family thiamine-binding protein [Marinobacterium arenosum]
MHVMIDLCVVPIGVGLSVSEHVAACQRVFEEAGLAHQMHAYGTNVEGDWDAVFAAVKRCHEVVHQMGAARISSSMRIGTRTDREQNMADKVRSVEQKLGRKVPDDTYMP